MKIYLVLASDIDLTSYHFEKDSLLFGVDRGALKAIKAGFRLEYAVGDFDSVTAKEKDEIKGHSNHFVELNSRKDDTDTAHAYHLAKTLSDDILILGGVEGKRIEHFLAIVELLRLDQHLVVEGERSLLRRLDSNNNPLIIKKSKWKFYSFFAFSEATISLLGFKYPLDNYVLKVGDPLCVSNEIQGEEATITLQGGPLLLVETLDDSPCK